MRLKTVLPIVAGLAISVLLPGQSRADTIRYDLVGADFVSATDPGSPITGYFDWNPATGLVTDWDITVAGWTSMTLRSDAAALGVVTANDFVFADSKTLVDGAEAFVLDGLFASALPTVAGDSTTFSGTFIDSIGTGDKPTRVDAFTITGMVTATPEPGGLACLGLGLLASVLFMRKQRSKLGV